MARTFEFSRQPVPINYLSIRDSDEYNADMPEEFQQFEQLQVLEAKEASMKVVSFRHSHCLRIISEGIWAALIVMWNH